MTSTFLLWLLAIATACQCLYFFFLIKGFLAFKPHPRSTDLPVSVIIAARNEAHHLPTLLRHLMNQHYPHYEIIIINDRSTDNSLAILKEAAEVYKQLCIIHVDEKPEYADGKKHAIMLGIQAATNDIILLTDADCVPSSPHWIAEMASRFSHSSTKINLGVSLYHQGQGLLNQLIQFETLWTASQYIGFALVGMPYMGVGRNLAYRKHFFLANNGFNDIMDVTGGDDDLVVNKLSTGRNTTVTLGADSIVYSQPKMNWNAYRTQKTRHLSVGKKYKIKDKIVLGTYSISLIMFWLTCFALPYFNPDITFVIILALIRTLLLYLTFIIGCKKIGIRFQLWGLLFLDFIFAFYYLSTGVRAIFTKKVRWS